MVSGPGLYALQGPMLPIGTFGKVLEVKGYWAIGWIQDSPMIWASHTGKNLYPDRPELDIVKPLPSELAIVPSAAEELKDYILGSAPKFDSRDKSGKEDELGFLTKEGN